MPLKLHTGTEEFNEFANDTIKALDTSIEAYDRTEGCGYSHLPMELSSYVAKHSKLIQVCPHLARKGVMVIVLVKHANISSVYGSARHVARLYVGRQVALGLSNASALDEILSRLRASAHCEYCAVVIVALMRG